MLDPRPTNYSLACNSWVTCHAPLRIFGLVTSVCCNLVTNSGPTILV